MSIEAIALIRERCRRFTIDCDWRDGYLGVATSAGKARDLVAGADHLEQAYGYPMQRIAGADLPAWIDSPRYHAAVHDPRSGHLHPLKYTRGLTDAAGSRAGGGSSCGGHRCLHHARASSRRNGPQIPSPTRA